MEAFVILAVLLIVTIVFVYLQRDTTEPDVQVHRPINSEIRRAQTDIAITPRIPPPAIKPAPPTVEELSVLPQQFVVLDLETTGLIAEWHEIIEVGAIRVTIDADTHPTFQTLVKPRKKIPRRITELTGISQGMVESEGLELVDVLTQFVEFIQDLPLVTFNADFDMGFLHNAAERQGLAINNRYTCAMKLARRAWPGLPSYRLTELAKIGHLSDDGTHRALGDCKRTMIVFAAAASEVGNRIQWTTPAEHTIDPAIRPWMDADREIRRLVDTARQSEKTLPEMSIAQYRDAIFKIKEMDSTGPVASAWRTARYPIGRLSLVLYRQGRTTEALTEIARWRQYTDPLGIGDVERAAVTKRELRLAKPGARPSHHAKASS